VEGRLNISSDQRKPTTTGVNWWRMFSFDSEHSVHTHSPRDGRRVSPNSNDQSVWQGNIDYVRHIVNQLKVRFESRA
jgi:hypothetical protein